MWTITDPKSSSTQCDAARPLAPDRPDLLVAQPRDDPVRDRVELALRPARADHEVVGEGRQRRELEQDDVGRLLVLGELDDAAGEVERGALVGWRARRWRVAAGRRRWAPTAFGSAGSVTIDRSSVESW